MVSLRHADIEQAGTQMGMNLEPPREEACGERRTSGMRLGSKSPIPDAHD